MTGFDLILFMNDIGLDYVIKSIYFGTFCKLGSFDLDQFGASTIA